MNGSMAVKTTREFSVENLGCAHCAAEIEHEVGKLDGVSCATLDFVSKTLRVELLDTERFEELSGKMEQIAQNHEPDIRLTERRPAEPGERMLYLKGLHCADCAAKIEREVGGLDGMQEAQLNFAAQRLLLKAENKEKLPVLTREAVQIINTIEPDVKVGFREEEDSEDEDETKERTSRIVLAIGVVIFLAAIIIPAVGFVLPPVAEFLLFFAAYLMIGGEILLLALRNIRRGQIFDENFLMSLATVGAFAIGEFPEGVAVMLFYRIGELFQDMAVNRSRRSIKSLMDIRPDFANLKLGEEIRRVSPEEVGIGDLIVVKPGEKIPLDGVVTQGHSSLDTSALTGESLPRDVEPGSTVLSGSINQTGLLTIEVQKEFGESTASKILELVQNAGGKKAHTENFITKFARYYTPVVVFAAAALAVIPPMVVPGATFSDWIYRALAFLVVSCPCALVISIPLSFFGGIGAASQKGILIKGSNYLEALNNTDTIVFDKTGTLTKGSFTVTEIVPTGISDEALLRYAALAESASTHPIALSVLKAYGLPIQEGQIQEQQEVAGHGVRALIDGKTILAGNSRLMESENISFQPISAPGTMIYVAVDGEYAGHLVIADEIKPDSRKAIAELKQAGVKTIAMLTGDNAIVADQIAQQLGIDTVYSELLPQQKVERVELLDSHKAPGGKLLFVGDGINDAPVLARADIGIAMGGIGSDAAIEAADIVLMTDEPSKLVSALNIAKKTRRIVWQNIVFALGVKVIILVLAAMGIASMWMAVFGDVGVALIAVLNAMRALKTK